MPLWRLVPVTDADDPWWLDHQRWDEVIVRADTLGLALSTANRALAVGDGQVGNESVDLRSGVDDQRLYRADRVRAGDIGMDPATEAGPPVVLRARRPGG